MQRMWLRLAPCHTDTLQRTVSCSGKSTKPPPPTAMARPVSSGTPPSPFPMRFSPTCTCDILSATGPTYRIEHDVRTHPRTGPREQRTGGSLAHALTVYGGIERIANAHSLAACRLARNTDITHVPATRISDHHDGGILHYSVWVCPQDLDGLRLVGHLETEPFERVCARVPNRQDSVAYGD